MNKLERFLLSKTKDLLEAIRHSAAFETLDRDLRLKVEAIETETKKLLNETPEVDHFSDLFD
jgi:hypothetical protein